MGRVAKWLSWVVATVVIMPTIGIAGSARELQDSESSESFKSLEEMGQTAGTNLLAPLPLPTEALPWEPSTVDPWVMETFLLPSPPAKAQTSAHPKQAQSSSTEADALLQQGKDQFANSQFQAALETWETALVLYRTAGDRQQEAEVLRLIGNAQAGLQAYSQAIAYYEQSLDLAQTIGDRQLESIALNNLGAAYNQLEDYPQAVDYLEAAWQLVQNHGTLEDQALILRNLIRAHWEVGNQQSAIDYTQQLVALVRESGDRPTELSLLITLSRTYLSLERPTDAIELLETALPIAQDLGDRESQANILGTLGLTYHRTLSDHQRAIAYLEEALVIAQELGNNTIEITMTAHLVEALWAIDERQAAAVYAQGLLEQVRELDNPLLEVQLLVVLGDAYTFLSQYQQADDLLQRALVIARQIEDQAQEADALNALSWNYFSQDDYPQAIVFAEAALTLTRAIGDREGEAVALNTLGTASIASAQYDQGIEYFQQALVAAREVGNQRIEAYNLGNIGEAYRELGQYEQAINYYQQAIAVAQPINDRQTEGNAIANLGTTYWYLGQYERAIDLYEQSLVIHQELGNRQKEATVLVNIGSVYRSLAQYQQAIDFHQRALTIAQDIGNPQIEAYALANQGSSYIALRKYQQAIDLHQQSLDILRRIGDPQGEATSIYHIGLSHAYLGQYPQALDFYQQALTIARNIGTRNEEGVMLSAMGRILKHQNQPQLAIVFLKASVEVRESIRSDISGLDTELQQSFTDTIADDYRLLAELLLEQGRIPEAQQVLDLLKLEELREFTNTRAVWTSEGIRLTAPEQVVADAHDSLIALGGTLIECERTNCADLDTLYNQQEALLAQYDTEVARFTTVIQSNRSEDEVFQNPDNISGEAQQLLEAYAAEGQDTVLIYPFVLPDKLWLVWVTVGDVVGSVEVPVAQGELSSTVQRFGELLQSGNSANLAELEATSQKLYGWIIDPLAEELNQNDIDHLVFVSDRVTRYIPMGALHNGDKYLLEDYIVSTVLTPKATNMDDRLTAVSDSSVLGLGLTRAISGFSALPAVQQELSAIVRGSEGGVYPGQVFLDEAFTFDALRDNLRNHRILHMATHAEFVPGRAEESYLVLGDGNRLQITDIEVMQRQLRNIHLVVLSACQTALGGPNQDGTEIAGLSSYFLEENRAEAVLASLWAVNDASTSLLMQRFYAILATGEFTKAEALRQAQLSLLYGEDIDALDTRLNESRAGIGVQVSLDADLTQESGYRHPFHWAPFIIIGNGL